MLERWPRPLLLGENGEQQLLQAAAVGKPPFSERELQAILARHPQLLPVAQFDPLFGPPVCIGREVSTDGAGPLDLLYVSSSGYLTLVETKLWKSSEARRQVVAQIIDYTRRIVRWDYSRLENAFLEYARQYRVEQRGLIPYVAEHSDEDLDETAFTDALNRNLRLGRVLLLIVGDGIREGVEEMTAYLQDAPNLQFTLGLVELGCYSVTAGPAQTTLLVPRIVMRTAEVTRAIVQIEMSEEAARRIAVTTATPPAEGQRDRTTLSKTAFYELLQKSIGNENANRTRSLIDRLVVDHEGLEEDFTTKKLALRADLASGEVSMPLIYISTGGAVTVYRWLAKKLSERGIPADAVSRFLAGLQQIDALFPARVNEEGQIQGFKAADKNAGLTSVLRKFAEFERLLVELVQEIERRAAETV